MSDAPHQVGALFVPRGQVPGDVSGARAQPGGEEWSARGKAEGIAWIEKRLGRAGVLRLLDDGPRAILAGEIPD